MIKIAGIAICAALLALPFQQIKREYAMYIALTASLILFGFGIGKVDWLIKNIQKIQSYLTVNNAYIAILLKIIGITFIAEFSANFCKDAGYSGLANQIEWLGKLSILSISMPIILLLLETISNFLG